MYNWIYIVPMENGLLRDTDGTIVPKEGKKVPLNTYWSRRIKKGDCTIQQEPELKASKKSEKKD